MNDEERRRGNRRKFHRVKLPIYYRAARFRTTRTPVVDIGLGGFRVYSDEPLKIGDRFDLELFLPDQSTIKCLVKVAWVKEQEPDHAAKYDIGLQLLDAPDASLEQIKKLIEED